jgi:DNA-binding transcriptional LysR family regulator
MTAIGSNVTLHQLRCLVAVADVGSVTSAARMLGISQPSVSQQLARVEAELGVQLFRRRSRSMVATPSGDRLVTTAREVLGRLDQGLSETRGGTSGLSPTLTVGVVSSLATSVFPQAVMRWRQSYPDQGLRLREELRRVDLERSVRMSKVDLAVGVPPESWAGVMVAVGSEELTLVVTPDRRPQLGATARLAAFADDPWVLYDPDHGLHEPVMRACASAGFHPHEVLRTRQVDTAVQMAAAGVGVAVAPAESVPSELAHLRVSCRPALHSPVAVWGPEGSIHDAERLAAVLRPAFSGRQRPNVKAPRPRTATVPA